MADFPKRGPTTGEPDQNGEGPNRPEPAVRLCDSDDRCSNRWGHGRLGGAVAGAPPAMSCFISPPLLLCLERWN